MYPMAGCGTAWQTVGGMFSALRKKLSTSKHISAVTEEHRTTHPYLILCVSAALKPQSY